MKSLHAVCYPLRPVLEKRRGNC